MYENRKIYNYENMKYTNIRVEKYKCDKCKRICKEYIYI